MNQLVADRSHLAQIAQFADFGRQRCRIQKSRPDNGLHHTERGNRPRQNHAHGQKFPEILIGSNQRISNQHERGIEKIDLEPKDAIEITRRIRVQHLDHCPPEEQAQRNQERRPK